MRTVDFMRGLREYDERKNRLVEAQSRLWQSARIGGLFYVSESKLVELIHEVKVAHAAFEALFVDREQELQELLEQIMLSKAAQSVIRYALERNDTLWDTYVSWGSMW